MEAEVDKTHWIICTKQNILVLFDVTELHYHYKWSSCVNAIKRR